MKGLTVRTHTGSMLPARLVAMVVFAALLSAVPFHAALAATAPDLGSAESFAVLGGTNVTCTNGSVVTGDVGVFPGSAVPFTSTGCTIAGETPPATNVAAEQARTDFLSAYTEIQQYTTCIPMPGNLAGLNLAPGVYCVDDVAKAGTLTLTGPSDGVWIFLVGGPTGALTGTNFLVAMADGGQACNVFWAPSGAVTMTDSALKGNILAGDATIGSITLTRGTLAGRALANVAVTMTGASVVGCGSLGPPPSDEDQCKQYCKQYCKDYWKHHCKDYDKHHCKHHDNDNCRDDDRDCDRGHDKDDDKDHHDKGDKDKEKDHGKDNRNRR